MFLKAYLQGLKNMVESKSDLERLRFMPQKIEDGKLVNFEGSTLLGGLNVENREIFNADRVNNTKRYTAALSRDYFIALDGVMHLFGDASETAPANDSKEEYGADILALVEAGDRKGLRSLLKEYKKTKWKSIEDSTLEDDIDDLVDCAADKAVEDARAIIKDIAFIDKDIIDDAPAAPVETKKEEVTTAPANEDEAELIADLEDALADEDYEDVELLLKELGAGHARYAEFEAKLPSKGKEESKPEESGDDSIIDEICEDIDAALEDGDLKDAKSILEELADEAGKDSDVYKEYEAKVNPPKERTRRSRRERG